MLFIRTPNSKCPGRDSCWELYLDTYSALGESNHSCLVVAVLLFFFLFCFAEGNPCLTDFWEQMVSHLHDIMFHKTSGNLLSKTFKESIHSYENGKDASMNMK